VTYTLSQIPSKALRVDARKLFYSLQRNALAAAKGKRRKPVVTTVQSPFIRAKEAKAMLGGRSLLERCERTGWFAPVKRGKRMTLFRRKDIEAAIARIGWGEMP
jgi:hypothetical protein